MNKEIALKILEINKNDNLSYEEKIRHMENIAGTGIETHTNINTGGTYGKRNCYILEAYKFLKNYKSREWISSKADIIIKQNEEPIKFTILTKDNKELEYVLYNSDQIEKYDVNSLLNINISRRTLNCLLRFGIDTIEKLKNCDLEKIKMGKNIGKVTIKEIINILKEYTDIEIDEEKLLSDYSGSNIVKADIDSKANLKKYLLIILNNECNNFYKDRNNEIFKLRYGLINNEILTLEALGNSFEISRERIRQIISRIIKRLKGKCKREYNQGNHNAFSLLYNYLQTIKDFLLSNSKENYLAQQFIDKFLTKEFENNNLIYLDLINQLCSTDFKVMQSKEVISNSVSENMDIKKAILACIREFSGKYGRGGIAKILKGSTGLKENDHNNDSINSKYYGLFKQLTLSYITSEIDELIKNEMLVTTKVSFGRPILKINPKYENEIDSIAENIILNDTNETNDDENILRVLYLIKQKKNVFITGHAGTGKSYILSKLKEKIPKLVITSTTGIAAVNVKGQTIHSWAGIGICNRPIEQTVEKILKKSSVKNQIQKCKILAIDEISMLDIKTFEYVDSVLRQVRSCDEPFGGIQVLFIGDFFQLPPVEKNENSAQKYCFESKLWENLDLYTVLLTKNYRQNEENLITALSNMRTNSLTDADVKLLKTRECKENIDTQNALHIFATNQEADNYNNMKFNKINSKEYKLYAIDGVYKGEKLIENPTNLREENILKRIDVVCSAEKSISLKIGVRVMLLINYDFEKGLINGSCGEVKEISEDYILVYFDNGQCAKITRHDFEFYNNEKLIALRRQFPLRLAYGITIHKSQGMSLDKLVVDCSRIFEKGQAYVALSRIKTLNGLYLHNFNPAKVMVDNTVVEFYKNLKIFDKKVELTENINISQQQKENSLDNKLEDESIEYYVDKIKNIILENNRWIEIFEIAEILGVNRHKKLVEDESNSTIAHLINRRLKKEGFITKRINYDKGYSIVVAPPGFSTDNIPEEIQVSSYKNRK